MHGQRNLNFGKRFVFECYADSTGRTLLNYLCRNSEHNMAPYIISSYVTSVVTYYPPNILHVQGSRMGCSNILISQIHTLHFHTSKTFTR
jgi:hypothetical protein